MDATQDKRPDLDKALDKISVAPPEPAEGKTASSTEQSGTPEVREAQDAEDHEALAENPADEEGKLDVGLDESFPSSDPPAATQPGHADPAPSSGYDEEAEKAREQEGRR